jgi:PAS domain-containing protein
VLNNLEAAEGDIPYALLYAVVDDVPDREEGSKSSVSFSSGSIPQYPKKCILAGTMGILSENPNLIDEFSLPVLNTDSDLVRYCSQAWESRTATYISTRDGTLPEWLTMPIPDRSFGDEIRTALVSPLRSAGDDVLGILITGINPRSPLDASYKLFLRITGEIIEKAAALISLPDEQRRAQAITDDITTSLTQQLRLYTLQAERSEAKFSRMAASSPIGMYMFDATDGRPLYANAAYMELLGISKEAHAIVCKPTAGAWEGLIHDEDM